MDISLLNGFNKVAGESLTAKKSKEKDRVKSGFRGSIKKSLDSSNTELSYSARVDEELPVLMDNLFKAGNDLVENPTLENLRIYKKGIKSFMEFVIENSLGFLSDEGLRNPRTFETKCYSLISVVDKRVDELAKSILSDQKKQLNLLGDVEEVNGMLVDLIR